MYGYPYGGYGQHCGSPCRRGHGYGNNFALIVVLFILLIIVGAALYC
ncbi:YjcZ family sporulation protein [Halobacillus rhizosphaerae]